MDTSSLEDMKEIAKRLIFGLRQSLQFIDPAAASGSCPEKRLIRPHTDPGTFLGFQEIRGASGQNTQRQQIST